MNCPSCKKWEITQFDSFCSWCRTKLGWTLACRSMSIIFVSATSRRNDLTLTLTHTGCGDHPN